jgi:hypothetical protein
VIKKPGNTELNDVVEHGIGRSEAIFAVRVAELLTELFGSLFSQPRE